MVSRNFAEMPVCSIKLFMEIKNFSNYSKKHLNTIFLFTMTSSEQIQQIFEISYLPHYIILYLFFIQNYEIKPF